MNTRSEEVQKTKVDSPVTQSSCITEMELGACAACPGYQFLKPHQRHEDGTIKIKCFSARGMVSVKTDVTSYQQCEVYKQDQRMI